MADVIEFPGLYYGDEPPVDVLEKAKSWPLECVLIIGQDENGKLVMGGSTSEMKDMVWLVNRALWEMARYEHAIMENN